jgi:hypothetical protein
MNKGLRQEIYKKRTLHNKFLKQKTNKNWEAYRKIELFVFTPLLDKKGFIVGQKSLDFGPPAHLS